MLSYMHCILLTIRYLKSRRLRWAGQAVLMEESTNAYRVLVGRSEKKISLEIPKRRCEDNIKMDLKEVGSDARNWMDIAQERDNGGLCKRGNEPPISYGN